MIYLLSVICVISCVLFIGWQWKMVKKYALTYDKFKINQLEKYITVNGKSIHFEDIDVVSVRELPQPEFWEKALSKSACYAYMAQIEFHLKNGNMVPVTFNTKGALYQTLKQLEGVVPVRANIDLYKPATMWWLLLWIFILGLLVFIFKVG